MDRSRVVLVIVSLIAAIVIIVYFLTRNARAITSDQVCGPGFELTLLPEYGGWRCFDGQTVQIPLCPDGKFWDRENGKCLTECPPGYEPSPGKECIFVGHVPDHGLITGRLLESGSSAPIPDWEVHIEYLHDTGIIESMAVTNPDGTFVFDIEIFPSPTWVVIEIFIGGGNLIRRTANGVTGNHDFGDFVFSTAPPGPPEFHRVYQVREQIQELPFDPAFPFDSWWKVACNPIDLTGASGAWKSNVFYHDWGQNDCPGEEGIPDSKPYFLFKRSDGVYFVIQEGADLSESREIGGPYP